MLEVISVHIPKSAGTSLLQSLGYSYGKDQIYQDYEDRPLNPCSRMNIDPVGFFARANASNYPYLNGKTVVHGHFNISKYASIKNAFRVTFLREPIDRLLSHYFYWLNTPAKLIPPPLTSPHAHLLEYQLSPLEFMEMPIFNHFYTKIFFGGVDMSIFDFIGFYDTLDKDVSNLSRILNKELLLEHKNPTNHDSYQGRRIEYLNDPKFLNKAKSILSDDITFYERLRCHY